LLLTIEKLIYGGDGLSRLPADAHGRGKAVFVPFVLAGEKIEATLVEQKPGFARAQSAGIVESSPHRSSPACPYFGQCGGCHYQHARYEHQLEIKKEILRETLRRTAKLELPSEIRVHASPPWNYRNRSRLQLQTQPFAAGYFKMGSHELLPVESCPISSPLINRAIPALWQSGRAGKVPEGVREIEFFTNAEDTQLLAVVFCASECRRASVRAWAEELRAKMPEIAGVVAFRETRSGETRSGETRSGETRSGGTHAPEKLVSLGADHLIYQTQRSAFRVSAGSFFQTNRFMTDELVRIVTAGRSGDLALDLYAGVGLFSTALTQFKQVISVEPSQTSTADLAYNQHSNGKVIQATTEQYLARSGNTGRVEKGSVLPHPSQKPDFAVVDPPRSGLGESVAQLLAKLGAPRVAYVSCDPATLARDLVTLLAAGYCVEQVHIVDLFPQTFHLESVVQLTR
jgi:23S rRNA (uracil1939-C5)-methyltransferase